MLRRPRSGRPSRGGRRQSSGRQTGSSTSPSVFRPDHERQRPGAAGSPPAPGWSSLLPAARGACAPGGACAPAPARRRCRRPSPLRPGCSTLRRPRSGRPNGGRRRRNSGRRTGSSTSPSVFSPDHERRRPGAAGSPARRPAGARSCRPRAARALPTGPVRLRLRRPGADAAGRACFEPGGSMLRRPRSGRPSRGGRRQSSGRRTSPSPSVLSRSSSSQQRVVVGPALLGCAAGRFRQAGFCPHCRPAPDRHRWPGPPVRPGRSASCGSGSGQFDGDELGDAAGHTARTVLVAARRWRRTGACGQSTADRFGRELWVARQPR